jgi:hypothetical protein
MYVFCSKAAGVWKGPGSDQFTLAWLSFLSKQAAACSNGEAYQTLSTTQSHRNSSRNYKSIEQMFCCVVWLGPPLPATWSPPLCPHWAPPSLAAKPWKNASDQSHMHTTHSGRMQGVGQHRVKEMLLCGVAGPSPPSHLEPPLRPRWAPPNMLPKKKWQPWKLEKHFSHGLVAKD